MSSLIPEDLTQPGTHALVIGISRYRHFDDGDAPRADATDFGMEQLTAAARSASEFAAWLLDVYQNPAAPLRSLRVLLSPSPDEEIDPRIAALGANVQPATVERFAEASLEFRAACNSHRENVAIVYVAGHGVQLSKTDAVVLLEDFGSPGRATRLQCSIDVTSLHKSMRRNDTAKTQFWFVDACRQKAAIARKFEELIPPAYDVVPGDVDVSPLFLAATTGRPAYARPTGRTLFWEALQWALAGASARSPEDGGIANWHVSVTSLIQKVPARVRELAAAEGAEQSVDIAGRVLEAVLHEFQETPQATVRVELNPQEAQGAARATLQLDDDVIVADADDWPIERQVDAGIYWLSVEVEPPYQRRQQSVNVRPPSTQARVRVSP